MDTFLQHLWANKLTFFITFFVVFTGTYLLLVAADALPEAPVEDEPAQTTPAAEVVTTEESLNQSEDLPAPENAQLEPADTPAEMPLTLSIAKLDRTVDVLNPASRTIADLDDALLDGVVRHPDSATLAQEGNVFILGHSSYLPNVFNKNFQAFNGIQDLQWGDIIEVSSADTVYEYRVEKVYRARAQDVTVPIADTGNMLTLATCNSFGSVDDRYIVEAKQIGKRAI